MNFKLVHIIYIIVSLHLVSVRVSNAEECSAKHAPELTASLPIESSPMVSAVLLECPKSSKGKTEKKRQKPDCEDQLMVNIRMNPSFHIEKLEKFLILDEVYDPRKRSKAKIMSPYLIEISRGEPVMMYPLEFTKSVKCENCETGNKKNEANKHSQTNPPTNKAECNKPYEEETINKPHKDPMDRIVNKLAQVFSPATKIGQPKENFENPLNSCPNSNPPNIDTKNEPLETNLPDTPEEKNTFSSGHCGQGNAGPPTQDFENPPQKCPGDFKNSPSSHRQEEQAVVGINDRLMQQLNSRKMAQLGIIKTNKNRGTYKRGIFSPPDNEEIIDEEDISDLSSADDMFQNTRDDESTSGELTSFPENNRNEDNENEKYRMRDDDYMLGVEELNFDPSAISIPRKARRRFYFKRRKHRPRNQSKQYRDSIELTHNINQDINKLNGFDNCQCDTTQELPNQNIMEKLVFNNEYNEDAPSKTNNNYRSGKNKQFHIGNEFFEINNNDKNKINSMPGYVNGNKLMKFLSEMSNTKQNNNDQQPTNGIGKLWIYRNQNKLDGIKNPEIEEYSDVEANNEQDYADENNEAEFKNLLQNLKRFYQKLRPSTKTNLRQNNRYIGSNENKNNFINNERKLSTNRQLNSKLVNKYHSDDERWKAEPHKSFVNSPLSTIEKSNWIGDDKKINEHTIDDNFGQKTYSQEKQLYDATDDKVNHNYQKALLDFENSRNEDVQKGLGNYFESHSQLHNNPGYTVLPFSLNGVEISKGSKQLGWITDPQLDIVDPLDNLDTIYTERPPNKKYYYNVLQPPRSAARELIGREPPQFLPKSLPYESVIDDPYLSISDKIRVLEGVDPPNVQSERKLNQLTEEVDKTFIPLGTPFPLPIPMTGGTISSSSSSASATNNKFSEGNKRKRSFMFYDDLEMRETFDDIENEFDDSKLDRKALTRDDDDASSCSSCGGKGKKPPKTDPSIDSSFSLPMYEDIQPCSSCGGKNKKPPKTDMSIQIPASKCDCKENQGISCDCDTDDETIDTNKGVRSVSDAWYAVFNMSAPLPFLTTKIRIFRKRHNAWWKIAPSITLNSLSGIFANENLSVLFSSHVDIIQLEKALRLQNHKLIIPKDNTPQLSAHFVTSIDKKPRNLINNHLETKTVNITQLCMDPLKILLTKNTDELCSRLEDFHQYERNDLEQGTHKRGTSNYEGIRTIGDLGFFPTSMNLLEQCPNDKQRLCLNMLGEKAPQFTIKMKIPFRENIMINRNVSRVKITSITTDATTTDALQISVQVVNEGIEAQEYSIAIANCPTGCAAAAKTTVQRVLIPRLGETINFLLPFIVEPSGKHKQITCDVLIKTSPKEKRFPDRLNKPSKCHSRFATKKQIARSQHQKADVEIKTRVVATRKMTAEKDYRCFCVWECKCHCTKDLESSTSSNTCHRMSNDERRSAGLLMHCQPGNGETCSLDEGPDEKNAAVGMYPMSSRSSLIGGVASDSNSFYGLLHNALMLIVIMLLLGLLKAVIGRFLSIKIDKFGFTYVQPGRTYGNSTKLRRFLVNVFFFVIFPFVFWCKCFKPSPEDLLVASTEWQCGPNNNSKSPEKFKISQDQLLESESSELFATQRRHSKDSKTSKKKGGRLFGGEDTDYDNVDELQLAFDEGIFDDDDDDDEEVNTKFILQALVESRESLRKLLRDHSSQQINPVIANEEDAKLKKADDLVQALKSAQIVYRTFDEPVTGIRNIPAGVRYCIQGYFLPSLGREYEFINYNPLAQYRCIGADGKSTEILRPPVILIPKLFTRTYANKIAVLEANDLSVHPPADTPCINISTMAAVASSMAKIVSNQNGSSSDTTDEAPLVLRERILTATHARDLENFQMNYQMSNVTPENALLPPESSSLLSSPLNSHDACIYEFNNQLEDESEPLLDDASPDDFSYKCNTIPE